MSEAGALDARCLSHLAATAGAHHERLDAEAVAAVLSVAGFGSATVRRAWPAELSDREVEVLRLLARGAANKRVASELGISPKTVGHHVQHIYEKIDVSTRAAAALFAMESGLLQ